ncbi:MAG: DUF177 domain-containing protein [Firmicutes bacterium]|nr:DUF177 domain-containing protein [Candidatus Fiminaster equi]
MKLDILKLPYTKEAKLSEEVSFDPEVFKCHFPLVEVLNCHADVKVQRFEEFIYVTIAIKAKVVLQCSYTLQNFETIIKGVDELHFASSNEDDDDCIEFKGNTIELDQYIFNLLSASVPLSPKAPNAKAPSSGKGYRVLSEEEFAGEKEEKGNSQFDALKDLEFDE